MSFLAKLEIDGETMNVVEFQCSIFQDIDTSGKPSAGPNFNNVRIILESTKSTLLYDWMISNSQVKNGKVTFYRRDAISKMRELEFNEAYCINYDEVFVAQNTMPMQVEIKISAREIVMNGSKLTRNWAYKI